MLKRLILILSVLCLACVSYTVMVFADDQISPYDIEPESGEVSAADILTDTGDQIMEEEEEADLTEPDAPDESVDPAESDPLPLKKMSLTVSSVEYTGKPVKIDDAVVVTALIDGVSTVLVKDTDYVLSYENNLNAGLAVVTAEGIGDFTGTLSRKFKITRAPLTRIILAEKTFQYTGERIRPEAVVKAKPGGKTRELVSGEDYRLVYSENKNAGTATVTAKGRGNYSGTVTASFRIKHVRITSAELRYQKLLWTGSARTQSRTATVCAMVNGSQVTLKRNRDYIVSYENNTEIGTATMIFTGTGNYKGVLKRTFQIVTAKLPKAELEYTIAGYTGALKKPKVTVTRELSRRTVTLKKNRDYTVSYQNNREMGTAAVTVTGIGHYYGTRVMHFTIEPIDYLTWAKDIADNDYYIYGHNPPYSYSCSLLVGYALQNTGYIGKVTAEVGKGWLGGLKDKTGLEYAMMKAGFQFITAEELGAVNDNSFSIKYKLKPGDIIWRYYKYDAHIGFYMGDGLFIEARGGTNEDSIGIFDDFGCFEGIFRLPDRLIR